MFFRFARLAIPLLLAAPPANAATLGAFIGDPGGSAAPTFQAFTAAMGQMPAAVDTYVDYAQGPSGWAASAQYSAWGIADFNSKHGSAMMPVVGLPMATSKDSATADFRAIASGANDGQLRAIFDAYAARGFKSIDTRPGWEMNGDWYAWSVNPGNASDFVRAFQHIADVAHAYSGMKVTVTWNPGYVTSSTSYQSIFPGAQYVDSIGIDTYGAGSGAPSSAPLDPSTNPNTYTLLAAIALAKQTGKPLSLPETGAGPGDTQFPTNLASVLSKSGVAISYVNIWDDPTGGSGNLQWTGSKASEAAWKAAFAIITLNPHGGSLAASSAADEVTAKSAQQQLDGISAAYTATQPPADYAQQASPPTSVADLPATPADPAACARIGR